MMKRTVKAAPHLFTIACPPCKNKQTKTPDDIMSMINYGILEQVYELRPEKAVAARE